MTDKLNAFVRNNYYFGKLLSVGDFELEQAYFRNKMHLMNLLIMDQGVVKGLDIEIHKETPQKIIIKPGVCVDQIGRIIIVPEETTVNIESIEGFEIDRDVDEVMLSIKYHERFEGEALALDRNKSKLSEETFNQTVESYELYISTLDEACGDDYVPLTQIKAKQIGTDFEIIDLKPIRKLRENKGTIQLTITDKEPIISEDIDHGLGEGDVKITLSIVLNDNDEKCVYQGHQSLLKDLNIGDIEYGFMAYPERGSFIIIARGQTLKEEKVTFEWHATRY